ncbi:serine O-acetyltransferase [Ancylomarina sp. 16SWW S1-10-2]|uniref:serine O-acetyltransferase n=1 Tax=Ancylomarina sp. 16SWW S1-10-2 TaxID=2499681 RepID=UPI0027155328|nr:serine acetyltransferase [Ancylomarina sp. 16SWW S1-10-2]
MKLLFFFGQLFFLPHFILFSFSKNKKVIIVDLFAQRAEKEGCLWYYLTLELLTNRYFRTLFYFRTPGFFSKILRIFYPKDPSFLISPHTNLAGGIFLGHPFSTIINAKEIGPNLFINHLVTIGAKNGETPTIGANVSIRANAIIIGGVTIGDNATIGAGAVVVKDVPSGATVVGNPAKVICQD